VYDSTFENVQTGERTSYLFRLANLHQFGLPNTVWTFPAVQFVTSAEWSARTAASSPFKKGNIYSTEQPYDSIGDSIRSSKKMSSLNLPNLIEAGRPTDKASTTKGSGSCNTFSSL
jgi:hypothetical protein